MIGMTKPQQVLILDPSNELIFKGPFTEFVNANLTLTNPSLRDVFFKVKTTAPKFYCVRPNSGLIKAKDKTQINVMLQPVEAPESLEGERNRHKFMIQSAFATEGEQIPAVDQFWKTVDPTQIMDSKLRVIFQRPYGLTDETVKENFDESMNTKVGNPAYAQSLSKEPIPTRSTDTFNTEFDHQDALQKEIELRKMYQDEKANLERENYALMEKMEKLAPVTAGGTAMMQDSIPILHAILFALFAFLIGLVLGKLL